MELPSYSTVTVLLSTGLFFLSAHTLFQTGMADDQDYEDQVVQEDLSYVDRSIAPGVENEKCVIAAYRTTEAQSLMFQKHLESCDRSTIPLEWVIDIADEQNGWFYGTAYHYDDKTNLLHVMVPDKLNPTFDGMVPLDHRTVHLIECIDKKTDALFNKIVRESVVKIRWEIEWYEERDDGNDGRWIVSTARFIVRIANQLLVEDEDFGQETKGFVMITADLNLRLRRCIKGKGAEDFRRLIQENLVQFEPDALDSLEGPAGLQADMPASSRMAIQQSSAFKSGGNSQAGSVPIRKLEDMSKSLREYFSDIIDERERLQDEKNRMTEKFTNFVLNGDLDAGMSLYDFADAVQWEREKKSPEQEHADANMEESWNLCNRIERGLAKVLKANKQGEDPRARKPNAAR